MDMTVTILYSYKSLISTVWRFHISFISIIETELNGFKLYRMILFEIKNCNTVIETLPLNIWIMSL